VCEVLTEINKIGIEGKFIMLQTIQKEWLEGTTKGLITTEGVTQ